MRDDLILVPGGLRFRGRRYPACIGRGGISRDKREGDGATPQGVHRIVGMLYRADRIVPPVPWACAIGPGDLWSDDPEDPSYNHLVRAPHMKDGDDKAAGEFYRHERLRRGDPLYDLVILTNWNWPAAIPGKGSAIFIHQWRRPGYPTEGCVALRRDHLHHIAGQITPDTRLIVA